MGTAGCFSSYLPGYSAGQGREGRREELGALTCYHLSLYFVPG